MSGVKDEATTDKILDWWAAGYSASMISRKLAEEGLPRKSRGAISGIAMRARLRGDQRGEQDGRKRLPNAPAYKVSRAVTPAIEPPKPDFVIVNNPDEYPRVGIMELELSHCRWPYDSPAGVVYCGAPRALKSYCTFHHKLSYVKIEK